MRKILVVIPLFVTQREIERRKKDLEDYAGNNTEVSVVGLQNTVAVNSRAEADIAAPEFLDVVIDAEKNGIDAVISDCYCDVGVEAANEIVNIPVLGPLRTSAALASMLSQKFSIITVGTAHSMMLPRLENLGLDKNYVSTRSISFDRFFISFATDSKASKITEDALQNEAEKAIVEGAEMLILGCTAFPLAKKLERKFQVPIIDGMIPLKIAEALVDLDLRKARTSEEKLTQKERQPETRIKVLVPTTLKIDLDTIESLEEIANKSTGISLLQIQDGPKLIESANDVTKVSPFIIREAAKAEKELFHAVIIGSFEDPALDSAREVCNIPVVGLGETSLLMATILGRTTILTRNRKGFHLVKNTIRRKGIEDALCSVVCFDSNIGVEQIVKKVDQAVLRGTRSIIMDGFNSQELIRSIQSKVQVPILDSLSVAVKIGEVLHSLDLSHSKLSYPKPQLPPHHKTRLDRLGKPITEFCSLLYSD